MKQTIIKLFFLILVVPCMLPAQYKAPVVLKAATVIDSWNVEPRYDTYITMQGSMIESSGKPFEISLPENAILLDMTGKFIMPGIIDVHATFRDSSDLSAMFWMGVTTVNVITTDIYSPLIQLSQLDSVPLPQIITTVPIPLEERTWQKRYANAIDSIVNNIPRTADDARSEIQQLAAKGVKRICILYDPMNWCNDSVSFTNTIDSTIVDVLIKEAKKARMAVSVQAPQYAKAIQSANLGITSLEQGVIDQRMSSELVDRIGYFSSNYVPALTRGETFANPADVIKQIVSDSLFKALLPVSALNKYSSQEFLNEFSTVCKNPTYSKSQLPVMYDNCSAIIKNYIPIPMGTDLPMFPGVAAHLEMENFLKAGITPMQAIVSATGISAQCLGIRKEVGFIFAKCRADLIVLDKNPVEDIKNTRSISIIVKHGVVFDLKAIKQQQKKK